MNQDPILKKRRDKLAKKYGFQDWAALVVVARRNAKAAQAEHQAKVQERLKRQGTASRRNNDRYEFRRHVKKPRYTDDDDNESTIANARHPSKKNQKRSSARSQILNKDENVDKNSDTDPEDNDGMEEEPVDTEVSDSESKAEESEASFKLDDGEEMDVDITSDCSSEREPSPELTLQEERASLMDPPRNQNIFSGLF